MTIWIVVSFLAGFFIGVIVGGLSMKWNMFASSESCILLGKNEDGDDRIVFQLGMEYDEIKNYNAIVFQVKKE